MTVALSYAIQNKKFVHISEKIKKKDTLFCPHCKEGVIAKKGTKIEHHFAHKANSQCSATPESILHFESKMYLKELILHQTPVHFESKLRLLDKRIKRWFTMLHVQKAELSLQMLIKSYNLTIATEEIGLHGYVPDVLAQGDFPLAFEIFVTHAMEEEKITSFKNHQVDFIELIPARIEDGTFSYTVHNAHLPRFFDYWANEIDHSLEEEIKPQLYEDLKENKQELIKKTKEEIRPLVIHEVCETLKNNIHGFYLTHGEKLSKKQAVVHHIKHSDSLNDQEETLDIKKAVIRYNEKGFPYLMIEDKYKRAFHVEHSIKLFAELINMLTTQYEMKMNINEKGNVEAFIFVNTLDKIGFDKDIQQLMERNLDVFLKNKL